MELEFLDMVVALILAIVYIISVFEYSYKPSLFFIAAVVLAYVVHVSEEVLLDVKLLRILVSIFGLTVLSALLQRGLFFKFISTFLLRKKVTRTRILLGTCLVTAFFSAFIDNMLIAYFMISIILDFARRIRTDPRPLVVSTILISNIAAMGSLIGDTSNILIGEYRGFTYLRFFVTLGLLALLLVVVVIIVAVVACKEKALTINLSEEDIKRLAPPMTRRIYFYYGIGSLIVMTLLLIFSEKIGLGVAEILAIVSVGMLFLGGEHLKNVFEEIRWDYLVYVASLLVVMKVFECTSIPKVLANFLNYSGSSVISIFFIALIFSSLFDDLEVTVLAVPVLEIIGAADNVWWAFIAGRSLGSMVSPIGAYNNVISLIESKEKGVKITLQDYLRLSIPVALIAIPLSLFYITFGVSK